MIDTCSTISTIEFNDPMQNRIFKVGKSIKYSRVHKEKEASTISKEEDDKETAAGKEKHHIAALIEQPKWHHLKVVKYQHLQEMKVRHGKRC